MPYHSKTLLLAQKSQLCQLLLQNPSLNQVQLAQWAKRKYHLSKSPSHNTFFTQQMELQAINNQSQAPITQYFS